MWEEHKMWKDFLGEKSLNFIRDIKEDKWL